MKFVFPLLVVLLAVFAVAPLAYPGAFQSQSGLLPVYYLMDLHAHPSLDWTPTMGRAYDLLRGEGVLPYLLAELFRLIGFGALDAIKIVYALTLIASGLAMFALARMLFDNDDVAGLIAALVYVYLPYHLATVYVLGAFAESLAWALWPVAMWSLARARVVPTMIVFAALFLTLPGLAILFGVVAFVFAALVRKRSRGEMLRGVGMIVAGLVVGAILMVPAIVKNGAAQAADGFEATYVLPFQLFVSNFSDAPYQLGIVPLGLAIIAVALGWRVKSQACRIIASALGLGLVLTLLVLSPASVVWEYARLSALAARPYELLGFVGLLLGVIAGAVVVFEPRLKTAPLMAALAILPILATYAYLTPRYLDFAPTRPIAAQFDDVALLDYQISGPLRHGATVRVNMQWQALKRVAHDYTVFVQVRDANGKVFGQQDIQPQEGAYATIKWSAGEVISDTHTVQIDVTGPREGYSLYAGLYTAADGVRAKTREGATEIQLVPSGE